MANIEADIKSNFNLYANGGHLERGKLQKALVPIFGYVDADRVQQILKDNCPDVQDSLTSEQFKTLVLKMSSDKTTEIRETFDMFDKNHDGYITRKEYAQVLRKIGQDIDDELVEQIFTEADINNDGKIDFNEFMKMMLDAK